MIFIDEYDTPFIEAHTKGFYEEVRGGLSGLLHNSLKTSNSLKYAFITGIQRVAKENIFSDLNNLVVCDVTDQRYAAYFGFDSDETKELLEYYGLELNNKKIHIIHKSSNQNVTGIVVNEKVQVSAKYRKEIRQEIYYIRKFGLESHLKKRNIDIEKEKYINILYGKILYVLQINNKDNEFNKYKKFMNDFKNKF